MRFGIAGIAEALGFLVVGGILTQAQPVTEAWMYTNSVSHNLSVGSDGTVYFGGASVAVDWNGALRWAGDGSFYYSAIGADGTIYGNGYSQIYALSQGGSLKWQVPIAQAGYPTGVAIGADGTIYAGGSDMKLHAFFPDGVKRWEFETFGWIRSAPVIGLDGTVFVISQDTRLYAVNPDGSKKWERAFVGGFADQQNLALATNGTIYLVSSGNLCSISPEGVLNWTYSLQGGGVAPVVGRDGTIYAGGGMQTFHAVWPDGSRRWATSLPLGSDFRYGALASDGTVIALGRDELFALDSDGGLLWHFTTGLQHAGPPILCADGRLYILVQHSGNPVTTVSCIALQTALAPAEGQWPMARKNARQTGRLGENVDGPPVISVQPISQQAILNSSPYLLVAAEGEEPLQFQWFKDGNAIGNATNSMLRLVNVRLEAEGEYWVVVSNNIDTVTSDAAELVVLPGSEIHLYAGLTIDGEAGRNCRVEYTESLLLTNSWQVLTNFVLPTDRYLWFDSTTPAVQNRFYRAVID